MAADELAPAVWRQTPALAVRALTGRLRDVVASCLLMSGTGAVLIMKLTETVAQNCATVIIVFLLAN